jgi:hypothetical protein
MRHKGDMAEHFWPVDVTAGVARRAKVGWQFCWAGFPAIAIAMLHRFQFVANGLMGQRARQGSSRDKQFV